MSHARTQLVNEELRRAIAILQLALVDPDADPANVSLSHDAIQSNRDFAHPIVARWINEYLACLECSTRPTDVRHAVRTLAQHFKIPPALGAALFPEQGTLF